VDEPSFRDADEMGGCFAKIIEPFLLRPRDDSDKDKSGYGAVHSRSANSDTWAALTVITVCKSVTKAACTSASVAVGSTLTRLCPLCENTRMTMLMRVCPMQRASDKFAAQFV
jgi:hypothetical protein